MSPDTTRVSRILPRYHAVQGGATGFVSLRIRRGMAYNAPRFSPGSRIEERLTMIESDAFVQAMQDMGVNFFTGVPDSILGGIIAELLDRRLYTPAVREDEAVAMAAGAYMGGKIPAVLMQNSGLGTSLNALISLNVIYRQPCILIISWRGQGGKDAPEHLVMGEVMPQFLDTMKIPHRTLTEKTAVEDFKWVAETFMKQRIPVALFITKGVVKGLHP
jgi:sulfopyruvate decarboxylase subunit alpha